jgi:hypothetical protein
MDKTDGRTCPSIFYALDILDIFFGYTLNIFLSNKCKLYQIDKTNRRPRRTSKRMNNSIETSWIGHLQPVLLT